MLYGTDLWPLVVTQMKITGSSSSEVPMKTVGDHMEKQSEDIRKKIGLRKLEHIIKERRRWWL